jgi:ribosome maturation factor RimP
VVDLVVRTAGNWTIRRIPLTEIRRAAVQVEFSRPSARELELAGTHETEAEA